MTKRRSPLNGLVLAGGKSTRMGHDKGLIDWHGKPQRYYLADLLKNYCDDVFIACRKDQAEQIRRDGYNPLIDNQTASTQFGAILGALKTNPNTAWLVVACDMPFIDSLSVQYLIGRRDTNKLATSYADTNSLPEPLFSIWEPAAITMLEAEFKSNITCPRKALINNLGKVKLVPPQSPNIVANINTPEAAEDAKNKLAT